jgi:hypothetical protein
MQAARRAPLIEIRTGRRGLGSWPSGAPFASRTSSSDRSQRLCSGMFILRNLLPIGDRNRTTIRSPRPRPSVARAAHRGTDGY